MGLIICVASLKGGVGKTTTAVNLSTALALAERPTLLVDCDPLGHATTGMGIERAGLKCGLYQVMTGKTSSARAVLPTRLGHLKVLPSADDLLCLENECFCIAGREFLLRDFLREIKLAYDYVILDSPPSYSVLAMNAIAAADALLVPLQCEYYALEGLVHFLRYLRERGQMFNPFLRIAGILLTMVEMREKASTQIHEAARRCFDDMLFRTVIPRDTSVPDSAAHRTCLLLKDIGCPAARGYLALAQEIVSMGAGGFRLPGPWGKAVEDGFSGAT